ncbi:type III restriction-modification system: methylase [Mycoplasmopsis californica]|uniref:DNA methyltransferase n=2 Tax=Mycoplasmopsis californica TaxID=2113 RepID=UPI000EB71505|nr:site-specific DNA-methyltransferase [Mycoplasmopsis californica]BBG40641.1 type III restriction-modification system: methylase [Mycoplasmopsis californica]BBG41236.1 type III restriction-modification system: methylase [Mycoplasmopsis californica]BBG41829.1 type III restriction-modification system: methylase [Mycoplasmopsis californica]
MKKNIFKIVEEVLLSKDKYVSEDKKLLKTEVYSDIMSMNEDLLALLLSNQQIKDNFFKNIDGTLIFDKQKFAWFIESKEFLPDSYTQYANKIGLTHNGNFISKTNDVVLDFPYKDCVLRGGQDKDSAKRQEIFYNEIIASDEISRMLAPKVFTNVKRYSKEGIEENITFNGNDNLIIKGNNLIALSSLLKRYEGKVKCIYIDPPYNTGNDSFNYNDSFNHSTWLTFMKNRLELAKRLLSDDGVIFVHLDRNEVHYCKVLMDDIFDRKNEITTIVWLNKEGGGKSDSKLFRQKHEYILTFAKNINNVTINPLQVEDIDRYKEQDEYVATRGKYQLIKLDSGSLGWVKSLDYPIENDGVTYYAGGDRKKWEDRQNGGASIKDWGWRWNKEKFEWGIKNDFIVFKNGNVYTKQYLSCDNDGNIIPRTIQPTGIIEKYSNTQSNKHMKLLFEKVPFNYSKPEGLIYELLNYSTQQNDLVLDFHLGSGTTAAVAHKMGRRYIGIEQMDYIEDVTIERMKKVIDGEQGGISKTINWEGGGSFVYCELMENSKTLINKIQSADESSINAIKTQIYSDDRIIPYISTEELTSADDEFNALDLSEKKKVLLKLIDKNKLYVNYSDIEDEDFAVSEADKEFSNSFYKGN